MEGSGLEQGKEPGSNILWEAEPGSHRLAAVKSETVDRPRWRALSWRVARQDASLAVVGSNRGRATTYVELGSDRSRDADRFIAA